MDQTQRSIATQFFLMDRIAPPSHIRQQTIALLSRAEYDAIPSSWSFRCYGAAFELQTKCWDSNTGNGTATFSVW